MPMKFTRSQATELLRMAHQAHDKSPESIHVKRGLEAYRQLENIPSDLSAASREIEVNKALTEIRTELRNFHQIADGPAAQEHLETAAKLFLSMERDDLAKGGQVDQKYVDNNWHLDPQDHPMYREPETSENTEPTGTTPLPSLLQPPGAPTPTPTPTAAQPETSVYNPASIYPTMNAE